MNKYKPLSDFLPIRNLKVLCLTTLLLVGFVLQSKGQAQTYCAVTGKGGNDYNAKKVSTSGGSRNINLTDGTLGTDNYTLVLGQQLTIGQGATFTLTIEDTKEVFRSLVWIDWNGNRDFSDAGDYVGVLGNQETWNEKQPKVFTKRISVPSNAAIGQTRMRIVTGDTWTYKDAEIPPSITPAKVTPCGKGTTNVFKAASIKDFTVTITPPPAPPVAIGKNLVVMQEDATNAALPDELGITDADNSAQTVTFTATGGTLTLGTAGITFTDGANGSAAFKAAGTLVAVNTALDAATFTPTPNLHGDGAARISFKTRDDSGRESNTATVTINITPVNDAPTLAENTASRNPIVVNQVAAGKASGTPVVIPSTRLRATDIDHDDAGLTFTITTAPTKGVLKNGTTTLNTISGPNTFTQAHINADQITYASNVQGSEGTGNDSFVFAVSDGAGGSLAGQTFHIQLVSASSPTAIALSPATIAENSPAGTVVGVLSTTDTEQAAGVAHTYTLVSGVGGTDNASFAIGTTTKAGKLITSFSASLDYETKKEYSVRVQVTDDDGNAFAQVLTIRVTDVNEKPVATAPTLPVVAEDATDVALEDNINIIDPDGDSQTVTFSITGGTLKIGTVGITFTEGTNGSAAFKASGTLTAINTALDAATFTPSPNAIGTGAAIIAFSSSDGKGKTSETATVTFDVTTLDTSAKILTFTVPGAISAAKTINYETRKVTVKVPAGTSVTALAATFTLSADAKAEVGTTTQVSGTTTNDFTSPVRYTVTAKDLKTRQIWTVEVKVASQETQVRAFSIPGQSQVTEVSDQNRTVTLAMPHGTDVTALVATFTLSKGAKAKVSEGDNSVEQISGTTPNDFTSPVRYIVTAEDGVTQKVFTVTVTVDAESPLGIETLEDGVSVYPIPASDRLHIKMDNPFRGELSITLKSAAGAVIHHHTTSKQGQLWEESIPLNALPVGVYLLEVMYQDRQWIQKIVKY